MQFACALIFCHLWPLRFCVTFHIISQITRFSEKGLLNKKACFGFLYNFCLIHFSFSEEVSEILNIRFHENPSSGNRIVPCGRTDITNLIVTFRNFSNAPKNQHVFILGVVCTRHGHGHRVTVTRGCIDTICPS
jgi:hypothetical protein